MSLSAAAPELERISDLLHLRGVLHVLQGLQRLVDLGETRSLLGLASPDGIPQACRIPQHDPRRGDAKLRRDPQRLIRIHGIWPDLQEIPDDCRKSGYFAGMSRWFDKLGKRCANVAEIHQGSRALVKV